MLEQNTILTYQADFFVLRTPLLSLNHFSSFNENGWSLKDTTSLSLELKLVFGETLLQEAIYVASPAFYYELIRFLNDEISNEKDLRKMQISLFRYLSRMSSRCTPFGLFAGHNIGHFSDNKSVLRVRSSVDIKKHKRLDMDYMSKLAHKITSTHDYSDFYYYANSTLYKIGSKLRYIETIYENGGKKYRITHVDWNELLPHLINLTKKETPYEEIVLFLIDSGLTRQQAYHYIGQLIEAQILINSTDANVTGNYYTEELVDKLNRFGGFEKETKIIANVKKILTESTERTGVSIYHDAKIKLSEITEIIDDSKLFQVDIEKVPLICNLNNEVLKRVTQVCDELVCLGIWQKEKQRLSLFKQAFKNRYETAAVKLTEALDAEIGINYDEITSIQQNSFPSESKERHPTNVLKLKKYNESLRNGSLSVQIHRSELGNLGTKISLPDSICAMVRLYKGPNEIDQILEFKHASGPSAARMLGRFCHSNVELESSVKDLLSKEADLNPACIFAEIAHIPQTRMGNVLSRPHLRKYEIQFLANSTLPKENIIRIDDLYLKLFNDRLILFSKEKNCEIIPRLSSAHNFVMNSLQIYHFLGDMQGQDVLPSISWSWDFISSQEFLPRVYVEDVIVSLATWNLNDSHSELFYHTNEDVCVEKFHILKTKLKIPDYVIWVEGDNELLIDTRKSRNIIFLANELKINNTITLKESLFTAENLSVIDEKDNGYCNEILIPMTRTSTQLLESSPIYPTFSKNSLKRNFSIGSEWLYYKIYTGVSTADMILRDIIAPFVEHMENRKFIDKYFFIRYTDPAFHLRIRLHITDPTKYNDVSIELSKRLNPFINSGEIADLTMNTYKREVERYGKTTMLLSESYFYINSKCVTSLLSLYKTTVGLTQTDRLLMALKIVDSLCTIFKMSIDTKSSLFSANRSIFLKEFGDESNKNIKDQIQSEYRRNQNSIRDLIEENINGKHTLVYFEPLLKILREQKPHLEPVAEKIINKLKSPTSVTLQSLMSSYIHMFVNRFFATSGRFNEYVIYEYLDRYYLSYKARQKKN